MRGHHGPKTSREDAVEFLNGNPHRPKTGLYIGYLPLQDAFPNRAFLQAKSVGYFAHGEQFGTGSHTGTSSDVM
jgi:hypothetical protein